MPLTVPSVLRPLGALPARAELIAEELRLAILRGELGPGAALIERDLADALGVSKTPVREAIKTLVAKGLAEMSPYKGATVRRVDPALATDVYKVRLLLEPEAARLAAKRRRQPGLAVADDALRRAGDALQRAGDALQRAEEAGRNRDFSVLAMLNREFHHAVASAGDNPVLLHLLAGVQDQTALVATQGWKRQDTWEDEAVEHRAILDAVRAGDEDAAGNLMRSHIESALARLTAALATRGDSDGR